MRVGRSQIESDEGRGRWTIHCLGALHSPVRLIGQDGADRRLEVEGDVGSGARRVRYHGAVDIAGVHELGCIDTDEIGDTLGVALLTQTVRWCVTDEVRS